MLDFRRADAVRKRAERAMRRGMAITADDRCSRQREPLLGPDDVNNALSLVVFVEIFDAEFARVLGECGDLFRTFRIRIRFRPVRGRDVMIDDGERFFRRADLATGGVFSMERCR